MTVLWPVVALASDGPVALRYAVCLAVGYVQLSRAACYLQQILHVSFTQKLYGHMKKITQYINSKTIFHLALLYKNYIQL